MKRGWNELDFLLHLISRLSYKKSFTPCMQGDEAFKKFCFLVSTRI